MIRMLIGCVVLMVSLAAQAKTWAFDVYLDDRKIGTHTFDYQHNTLTSQADFKVKILMITAYEYHHTAVENWDGNCLQTLKADTVEDDEVMQVTGELLENVFVVSESKITQNLPSCTMTFAYWNPVILQQAQLLNPQNAEYLDVDIQALGKQTTPVRGQAVDTSGYQILGALKGEPKLNIKVWYDQNNDWVALQSTTPEGYIIDYRLQGQ